MIFLLLIQEVAVASCVRVRRLKFRSPYLSCVSIWFPSFLSFSLSYCLNYIVSSKFFNSPPAFPGIFTAFDCRAAIKIRKKREESIIERNKPNPNLGLFSCKITHRNDDKRKIKCVNTFFFK